MQSSNRTQLLAKRVAVVTGGGSGLGAEIARGLALQGASVCIADQNPDRARTVAQSITEIGGEAFGWQADITNKFQVSAMIEATRDRYDRLDILVGQAHVSPSGDSLTMDEWSVRRILEVNLVGTYLCAQLAARVMTDEDGGLIVLVYRPPKLDGTTPLVQATQQALATLAEGLNAELDDRVQVEALAADQMTIQKILTLGATLPSGMNSNDN